VFRAGDDFYRWAANFQLDATFSASPTYDLAGPAGTTVQPDNKLLFFGLRDGKMTLLRALAN
jgi:hypothetical protein